MCNPQSNINDIQLQVGAQFAYLINAKADSTKAGTGTNPYGAIMDYYNRFDYGAAGGVQIHPVKNLLIGARYNISFANIYKDPTDFPAGAVPSFVPKVDVKNNVLQLYVGLR
ncbi:MAG: PorT family protein [Chitinophagaceae bacterium]|nr:PorT family protein [Chitinophagaceae bacterium]